MILGGDSLKAFIDLHCHTISSGHAYSTISENINEASSIGLKYLGMSDHAPNMPGASHLFHFYNLKAIPKEINSVKVLKGVEANIIDYNGNIDIPEDLAERLDYVITSLHPPCIEFGSIEENTRAILKAMENKYVKIIGHPDDSRYPLDYEKVVKAAKKNNVLLEVNNSSLNPDGYRAGALDNYREMLRLCKEHGVKIILGSDAHISYAVGKFPNCEKVLEEIDFPDKLVINYNEDDIKSFLKL